MTADVAVGVPATYRFSLPTVPLAAATNEKASVLPAGFESTRAASALVPTSTSARATEAPARQTAMVTSSTKVHRGTPRHAAEGGRMGASWSYFAARATPRA